MTILRVKYFLAFLCSVLIVSAVWADAKDDAHARRKARWSSVAELLQSGDATEGANGYLVQKQGLAADKVKIIAAENKDRKIGYEAIAKENKTKVEAIAQAAGRINRQKADKLKK